jgi:hypothetical protein
MGEFTEGDRVVIAALHEKLKNNKKLVKSAQTDGQQIFEKNIFPQLFDDAAQEAYMESTETYTKLFEDAAKYKANAAKPVGDRLPMKKKYRVPTLPNGETRAEMLHRCRYLLYKSPQDWTDSQRQRAKLLFSYYPNLSDAYDQYIRFRKWYTLDPDCGKDLKDWQLSLWLKHAREIKQSPFNNFCSFVEANRDYIVNYFDGFHTNAIAESTNAKIQLAAIKNRGSRDLDFFLYRVANFL